MQHENQTKPFVLEINGLEPIDFGPIAPDAEPEAAGLKTQPEDMRDELDKLDFQTGTGSPQPASVDVWEHAYYAADGNGVSEKFASPAVPGREENDHDSYTATDDLWRWKAEEGEPLIERRTAAEADAQAGGLRRPEQDSGYTATDDLWRWKVEEGESLVDRQASIASEAQAGMPYQPEEGLGYTATDDLWRLKLDEPAFDHDFDVFEDP